MLPLLLLIYQVNNFDFVSYDDQEYVTENSHVKKGLTSEGLKWAFTSFHSANWHPITWLSHMLDCELYGLNHRLGGRTKLNPLIPACYTTKQGFLALKHPFGGQKGVFKSQKAEVEGPEKHKGQGFTLRS